MRIDAHQYFCDPQRFSYHWMPPEPAPLRRPFLPDDLQPILLRHHFDGCIAAQSTHDEQEANWLLDLAEGTDFILGVLASADLADSQLAIRLDNLQRHGKFAGVQASLRQATDGAQQVRPEIIRGFKELERRGVSCDLSVNAPDLPVVGRIAEEFPSLRLILNDFANPLMASSDPDSWAKEMESLAKQCNAYVKLSGRTLPDDAGSPAYRLTAYVQHVWKIFGPERCLFSSGWPECLRSQTWKQVLASFTQALGPVPMPIRNGVMGENAVRFYQLSK